MLPVIIELRDRNGQKTGAVAFATAPIRIGRNPLNDLHLTDSFVSQWHALVEFDERTTRFQDLGSTNGTLHQGKRLGREPVEAPLGVALELKVGDITLRILRGPADALLRNAEGKTSERLTALIATLDAAMAGDEPQGTALFAHDSQAVTRAFDALAPLYQRYRATWAELAARLDTELAGLPPALRGALLERMQLDLPGLAHEPAFVALAGSRGAARSARDRAADLALRGLQKFVELYTPHAPPLAEPDEVRRALIIMVRVLEHFTRSFVELRQGQEEFAAEMAVAALRHSSPLRTARNSDEVMSYLLDWKRHSPERIKELLATYADLMIHQVALVSGVMAGVRAILKRLDPDAIEAEEDKRRSWAPRWLRRLSARGPWRRFRALHEGFAEETALSAALFGREFARAYEAIGGPPEPKPAATVMFQRSLPEKRQG